jgi:hypothetical protein
MNDKDKQEFLKWIVTKLIEEDQDYIKKGEISPYFKPSYKNGKPDINEAWQAACEYKDKEIMNEVRQTPSGVSVVKFNKELVRKEIEKLEAENKKLREALQWYADRKNCDNPDFVHIEIDEHGEEIADGGYRAREALKEVDENER